MQFVEEEKEFRKLFNVLGLLWINRIETEVKVDTSGNYHLNPLDITSFYSIFVFLLRSYCPKC